MKQLPLFLLLLLIDLSSLIAQQPDWNFEAQLNAWFAAETNRIAQTTQKELSNIEDWEAYRQQARIELQEMLGLFPLPAKTPLDPVVTGRVEHEEFTVEKIHFQAMPGLYVTGNLYVPKNVQHPLPAILYVCGHAAVVKDGYNYGAKAHYQHHPAWFARNGYVCLIIDTVQLGEIEGVHHGLYRYDRWWWISRGYTPAGVEAWNGIRAIDYLISRPEVDADRIGVTGRSGGGVTSWWITALDDRVKVAVPVAGITDLQDHVVEGCVEGHCDCMYLVNLYQWDYAKVAALTAPRPVLLSNTDRDPIFPVEGVFRIYRQVRRVYEQLGAGDRFALNTTAGPHQDVQELRVHAFRWFNHYLRDLDDPIQKTAEKLFTPEQLRVFDRLPEDAINARVDETFVPVAPPVSEVLQKTSKEEAVRMWKEALGNKVFGCWPDREQEPDLQLLRSETGKEAALSVFGLQTDDHTYLPAFRIRNETGTGNTEPRVVVLDDDNWPLWSARLASIFPGNDLWRDLPADPDRAGELQEALRNSGDLFLISMRGAGPARFPGDEKEQIHIRRRYFLLGGSLNAMQTWDILQGLRAVPSDGKEPVSVSASGITAGVLLYASLYVEEQLSLHLANLPESHDQGPYFPNVLRFLDIPAAVSMAEEGHVLERPAH